MEPRIQYATTSDGVSIACWSIGEGIPLVNPPPALPWSHIELEWQIPEWRHWYEHLAETFQVIRYDNRGSGLSSGNVATGDVLENHIRDLDAVVDRLGVDRFALLGLYGNAPIPIAYAVRNPERVSHLILWCAMTKPDEIDSDHAAHAAFEQIRDTDYETYTELLSHTVFGWSEGAAAHNMAEYMRASLSQEDSRRCWEASKTLDVTPLLPQITQPTLVLHRRDFNLLPIDVSRRIASAIPNARLKVVSGSSLSPYIGDMRETLDAIEDFVGAEPDKLGRARAHPHPTSQAGTSAGFRTIMFTDMEGSTETTQRLGDDKAQELVRLHNAIVSGELATYGGSQVKHTGDGIMASFPTASGAVECAVAIQRAFSDYNDTHPAERVFVRIGLNAGEPVSEGDDLFGTAVQLARRVCDYGEPGQILMPEGVRHLVAGKGFLFADTGVAALKGFEDSVRLFEVRWREDA